MDAFTFPIPPTVTANLQALSTLSPRNTSYAQSVHITVITLTRCVYGDKPTSSLFDLHSFRGFFSMTMTRPRVVLVLGSDVDAHHDFYIRLLFPRGMGRPPLRRRSTIPLQVDCTPSRLHIRGKSCLRPGLALSVQDHGRENKSNLLDDHPASFRRNLFLSRAYFIIPLGSTTSKCLCTSVSGAAGQRKANHKTRSCVPHSPPKQ